MRRDVLPVEQMIEAADRDVASIEGVPSRIWQPIACVEMPCGGTTPSWVRRQPSYRMT
jgi:hypothetical protein